MVQLSHLYKTIGKTFIALIIWTFVGKVMSLLLNMLSRFGHSFSSKEQVSFNFMATSCILNDPCDYLRIIQDNILILRQDD